MGLTRESTSDRLLLQLTQSVFFASSIELLDFSEVLGNCVRIIVEFTLDNRSET